MARDMILEHCQSELIDALRDRDAAIRQSKSFREAIVCAIDELKDGCDAAAFAVLFASIDANPTDLNETPDA